MFQNLGKVDSFTSRLEAASGLSPTGEMKCVSVFGLQPKQMLHSVASVPLTPKLVPRKEKPELKF